MQDYLTFFRQNAERDRGRGQDGGWDLAIRHLEHFLGGSGKPLMLSSEEVGRMPALLKAEERSRESFESTFVGDTRNDKLNTAHFELKDGGSVEITDFWDSGTSSLDNRPGDYAAIGRSSVRSEGTFRATRKGELIEVTGEVEHRLGVKRKGESTVQDVYDFEAGQPGSFPALTLEEVGKARRFDMTSEPRRQSVSARVRVGSDGKLALEGKPSWGPIHAP